MLEGDKRMNESQELRIIARLRSDFTGKFGIPRQSGLADSLESFVVFEPAYRDENALRGLDGFSHIWLIWGFSEIRMDGWSPTVKPPRLGGNKRMGVFATRSPYRPNPIGLSSVRLLGAERHTGIGTVLRVGGADLMDGTPIYDIKPYLSFTDSHPDARNGFAAEGLHHVLNVEFPQALQERIPLEKRAALAEALRQDPRPAYQHDPALPYGFSYLDWDVRFTVSGDTLTVFELARRGAEPMKGEPHG